MRHYVLEYFRDVWNVWLKAKTTKDCQVAIDDLIPGSRWVGSELIKSFRTLILDIFHSARISFPGTNSE